MQTERETALGAYAHLMLEHVSQGMALFYASPTCTGGMSYWNWTLDPICEQGRVCYVLLTMTEVTSQVMARQVAQEMHGALMQTHQQRLQHIETILL
jgi:hypothetical protein